MTLTEGRAIRASRFGDWSAIKPLCLSGITTNAQAFYAGALVDGRMGRIRAAIEDIRRHWEDYPSFMRQLRQFLVAASGSSDQEFELGTRAEALLAAHIDWVDVKPASDENEHVAIALYTSTLGYRQMFGLINMALRVDETAQDERALTAAVFLVELLTIDLYNYCRTNVAARFDGVVFRGMCIGQHELAQFEAAFRAPIGERYISIPLAMMSASSTPNARWNSPCRRQQAAILTRCFGKFTSLTSAPSVSMSTKNRTLKESSVPSAQCLLVRCPTFPMRLRCFCVVRSSNSSGSGLNG